MWNEIKLIRRRPNAKLNWILLLNFFVNNIPIKRQWEYCNNTGVVDDDDTNVIQSKGRFAFKTHRITKQMNTIEITKKLQNTVVGEKGY